jgi:hypothetical protein
LLDKSQLASSRSSSRLLRPCGLLSRLFALSCLLFDTTLNPPLFSQETLENKPLADAAGYGEGKEPGSLHCRLGRVMDCSMSGWLLVWWLGVVQLQVWGKLFEFFVADAVDFGDVANRLEGTMGFAIGNDSLGEGFA